MEALWQSPEASIVVVRAQAPVRRLADGRHEGGPGRDADARRPGARIGAVSPRRGRRARGALRPHARGRAREPARRDTRRPRLPDHVHGEPGAFERAPLSLRRAPQLALGLGRDAAARRVDWLVLAALDQAAQAVERVPDVDEARVERRDAEPDRVRAAEVRDDVGALDQRAADRPRLRVAQRRRASRARAGSRGEPSSKPSGASHASCSATISSVRRDRLRAQRLDAGLGGQLARPPRPRRARGSAACRRGSARCPSTGS